AGEQAGVEPRLQIEDAVADSDAALRLSPVPAKDAEREILDRKIRVRLVCGLHEALARGVVGFVQLDHDLAHATLVAASGNAGDTSRSAGITSRRNSSSDRISCAY